METNKKCGHCKLTKSNVEFYLLKNGRLHCWCKLCCKQMHIQQKSDDRKRYVKNIVVNREKSKMFSRRIRKTFPEVIMLRNAKHRAKQKNIPFNLELTDIVIPTFCPVLGIELKRGVGKSNFKDTSPTLDRIIPELGYVKNNVAVISYKANRIKSDGSIDDVQKVLDYMKSNTSLH